MGNDGRNSGSYGPFADDEFSRPLYQGAVTNGYACHICDCVVRSGRERADDHPDISRSWSAFFGEDGVGENQDEESIEEIQRTIFLAKVRRNIEFRKTPTKASRAASPLPQLKATMSP